MICHLTQTQNSYIVAEVFQYPWLAPDSFFLRKGAARAAIVQFGSDSFKGAVSMMKRVVLFGIFLAASFATTTAFAQSDRGTMTGTVTDPAGAVVPNAPVQVKNTATGVVYDGATSTTGNYTVSQLPAG